MNDPRYLFSSAILNYPTTARTDLTDTGEEGTGLCRFSSEVQYVNPPGDK
jgi:hypothetical protein